MLLKEWAGVAKQQHLKEAIKLLSAARRERYMRCTDQKNNGLRQHFNEQERYLFFKSVNEKSHFLIFKIMEQTNLRIGDAVKVKLQDINFNDHTLTCFVTKWKRTQRYSLPANLYQELDAYIRANTQQIGSCGGFLFPGEKGGHLEPNYMRKVFHGLTLKTGLNRIYGAAKDGRQLWQFNTTSLRKTGIMKVKEAVKDPFKLKAWTGHKSLKSLEYYVNESRDDVNQKLDYIFDD